MYLTNNSRTGQSILIVTICLSIAIGWSLFPHPLVGIVLGLVPLLIIFVLKRPFLIVLLFVLFSFFRLHEVFPQLYVLRIPLLLSVASLGALLWHVGLTRKIKIYWTPELTRTSVFFIIVIMSIILASNRPLALNYFTGIYWKIIVMTFAIAWLLQTTRDFSLSLNLITLSGLLVGLVALYNKSHGIGLVEGTRVTIGRELGSVLGDPNDLSLVLLFPCSFAISLIFSPNISRTERLFGIVTAVILVLAILATQSRGGLLGIVAIIATFAWRRVKSKALLVCCGTLLLAALFSVADISSRESGGMAEEGVGESAMGRIYACNAAIGMAVDNPISGVGLHNFYHNYFFYSDHWDGLNHAVHSTWFGVLSETGFLGLCIFMMMVIGVIRCAAISLNKIQAKVTHFPPVVSVIAEGNLSGIIGFCVAGTFLTQGFTWPLYVLIAFTVGVAHYVSTNKTR